MVSLYDLKKRNNFMELSGVKNRVEFSSKMVRRGFEKFQVLKKI